MKWLVIGYSRIVQRRVLPALKAQRTTASIAVASRRAVPSADPSTTMYRDYEEAIEQSGADIAYVSLENINHAQWVERAITRGMHVVVDKPAFLTYRDARRIAAIAKTQRRCLAEAVVFGSHPQIAAAQKAFADAGAQPTRAFAAFSFPPLKQDDFRYRADRGGGALYDLGPYLAASSRLFFQAPPRTIVCRVTERLRDGLDISFSALLTYEAGRAFVGHFGFNTEYQNRLLLFGPDGAAELQPAFTVPPDAAARVALRRNNAELFVDVPAADVFAIFLAGVVSAIGRGDWPVYSDILLQDASLLERVIQAAAES
jgi:NDP-hexose-3-ketoreductase